jgi:hypothetical protein
MACKTDRRKAKLTDRACAFCRSFMPNDPFLVGIVAGRTGDTPPRHERKDHDKPFFRLPHGFERLLRRSYEEMLRKENTGHGRVAAPAKEPDVGPESYRIRPVRLRIGRSRMTHETHRLTVYVSHLAGVSQHNMGIYVRILFFIMALETDHPSICVRTPSQEFRGPFMTWAAVYLMTGQAPDFAVVQRKVNAGRICGSKEDGMMVSLVVMTVEAEG